MRQIITLAILAALGLSLPSDVFTHAVMLALFFATLLVLAWASYRGFERPAMLAVRAAWRRQKGYAPRAAATPAPNV